MASTNPFITNPGSMSMAEKWVYGALTFVLIRLSNKGYIPADWVDWLALSIISGGGSLISWWQSRPQVILAQAAQVPNPAAADGKTHIVTEPSLAKAIPDINVVSSTDAKVVDKT